jgi:hypothetical protein
MVVVGVVMMVRMVTFYMLPQVDQTTGERLLVVDKRWFPLRSVGASCRPR